MCLTQLSECLSLLRVNYDLYLNYFKYRKSKWVKDNGYGGVLIWEITQDDWQKKCCKVSYPMLRALNHGLFGTGEDPSTYGCE